MLVFVNGFWSGFTENTNGVNFSPFQKLLSDALNEPVHLTSSINDAEILLESHFNQSVLLKKHWTYSIFFSGEGDNMKIPDNSDQYTIILGAQKTNTNFVALPLYLTYDYSVPFQYPNKIETIPPKNVCAIISNCNISQYRIIFIEKLEEHGIHVDMGGRYKNNIGYTVPGEYNDSHMIEFQKQYRIVLALENTILDDYITEKIINPLRAGTVPIYLGSNHVNEFICKDRFIQITPDTFNKTVEEIQKLLTDDTYWLEKVNTQNFVETTDKVLEKIASEMRILFFPKPYGVELIANYEKEVERHENINRIIQFYNIQPTFECWGQATTKHPLFIYFEKNYNIPTISLSINHITILKKYSQKNTYLLVCESDAISTVEMDIIDLEIKKYINIMQLEKIDFIFLGTGCFNNMSTDDIISTTYNNRKMLKKQVIDTNNEGTVIDNRLIITNMSRCTEAYLISPKGITNFLEWFYSRRNNVAIDWTFNYFFRDCPTSRACWINSPLFYQGSASKYKSHLEGNVFDHFSM